MSLIFDPRASALAAYMMNPLLYDSNAMSLLQNRNPNVPSTILPNISNSNEFNKLQQQSIASVNNNINNNNNSSDQNAAMAAIAAATAAAEQQAAALNFAAQLAAAMNGNNHSTNGTNSNLFNESTTLNLNKLNNNSNENSPSKSSSASNFSGTSASGSAHNTNSGSFRILDLLDASSAENIASNAAPFFQKFRAGKSDNQCGILFFKLKFKKFLN